MLFTLRWKKRMQEMMTVANDAREQCFSSALVQMLSKVKVESSRYGAI